MLGLVDTTLATVANTTYRFQAPKTVAAPHPTLVMLHGLHGNEEVMWVFARAVPSEWLMVAPRAPYATPRGYTWHRKIEEGEWPTLAGFAEPIEWLTNFIHQLPILHYADLNRVYLMGFSQGAAMAYATALHQPLLVKAIAGLVGIAPQGDLPPTLTGLPIFAAIGIKDDTVPLDLARAGVEALRRAGAKVDAREYDTGHKLNSQGMRDLLGWWRQIETGDWRLEIRD